MYPKQLGKICILAALAGAATGCFPTFLFSAKTPPAKSRTLGAEAPAERHDACTWRTAGGKAQGQCIIDEDTFAEGAIALSAARPDVTTISVRVGGEALAPTNYAYDDARGAVVFHATGDTPRLFLPGAVVDIAYDVSAELAPQGLVGVSDCDASTEEFEAVVQEIESLGVTCESDADCEMFGVNTYESCPSTHFAAISALTEERRGELERRLALVGRACGSPGGIAECGTDYPRTPSCDPDTRECVGRF